MIRVQVVIPVYGRTDAVSMVRFLRQHPCNETELQIFLIDNGNEKDVSDALWQEAGDDCRVIRLEENRGGAGAFRVGMLEAAKRGTDADFVWLLDDDAELNANTLPGLLHEFRRLEAEGVRIGCIGSVQLGQLQRDCIVEAGARLSPWTGRYLRRHIGESALPLADWTESVGYAAATSLLAKMQVVREVGPFKDMFIHGDDLEWGYRVRAAGWQVYVTTRSVVHHMEWEAKPADWTVYYDVRNLMRFLRANFPFASVVAGLLKRCQQFVCFLHGRKTVVRMMRLGFKHARTGELLLRKDLPPQPTWIPLSEVLRGAGYCAVLSYRAADALVWRKRLEGVSHRIVSCTGNGPGMISYFRAFLHQVPVQIYIWMHPNAVVLVDCGCVKRYPLPLFSRNKVFFWETADKVLLFRE